MTTTTLHDALQARGTTIAFVARQSEVRYDRVRLALAGGAGLDWLEPEEVERVTRVLVRLGVIQAGRPITP